MKESFEDWCENNNRQDLLDEWDYEKNTLKPNEITKGSDKKIFWRCSNDKILKHSYDSTISERIRGSNCPYCSNKRFLKGFNDLQTWAIYNNPNLITAYSKDNEFKIDEIISCSKNKIKLKCLKCNNFFERSIRAITYNGDSIYCVDCSKKIAINNQRLTLLNKTKNLLESYPEVAKQWNFEKTLIPDDWDDEILGNFGPKTVSINSHYKVFWNCNNGHSWETNISNRINRRNNKISECPYCSNELLLSGYNDFETWCNNNGRQDLINEWIDEFPMNQVMKGTITKYKWKCKRCNHEYNSSPNNRSRGNNCPNCAKRFTKSKPEYIILFYLNKLGIETIQSYKPSWIGKSEIDIYIPSLNIGIEYDGEIYHKDTKEQDELKNKLCKDNGVTLYRIREPGCPILYDNNSINFIRKPKHNHRDEEFKEILENLFKIIKNKKIDIKIDFNKDNIAILEFMDLCIKNNSIVITHPNIAKLWDYEKNGKLLPEYFTYGSGEEVWFKCENGKTHSSFKKISTRCKGYGCPYCSNQKLLSGFNDLATLYPVILEYWDYDRNKNYIPENWDVDKQGEFIPENILGKGSKYKAYLKGYKELKNLGDFINKILLK